MGGKRKLTKEEAPFYSGHKITEVNEHFSFIAKREEKIIELNVETLRQGKDFLIEFLKGDDSKKTINLVAALIARTVLRANT